MYVVAELGLFNVPMHVGCATARYYPIIRKVVLDEGVENAGDSN